MQNDTEKQNEQREKKERRGERKKRNLEEIEIMQKAEENFKKNNTCNILKEIFKKKKKNILWNKIVNA